jgi:hypothetical protein
MDVSRRRRSLLSDATKVKLAQVQGAGDRVLPGPYYGYLTSEETGNFVKLALSAAEHALNGEPPIPIPSPQM